VRHILRSGGYSTLDKRSDVKLIDRIRNLSVNAFSPTNKEGRAIYGLRFVRHFHGMIAVIIFQSRGVIPKWF
jgi:hypothetical protein